MRKLSLKNFVVRKLSLIFAACSKWNKRPKIQKSRDFNKFKIMTNNEIKEQKTRQMARVISMATSLHYAIEELMSMMIAEDENEDFSLVDSEDEDLYLALGIKADEIDKMADMISERYKAIKNEK